MKKVSSKVKKGSSQKQSRAAAEIKKELLHMQKETKEYLKNALELMKKAPTKKERDLIKNHALIIAKNMDDFEKMIKNTIRMK